MENYQPPTADFLKIVLSLDEHIDELNFTQLFVRACALHKGEELLITARMAEQAL